MNEASNTTARALALGAVVGPALFTTAWLLLGAISPGFTIYDARVEPYSWVAHPVSGLGLGITGAWMNAAFVATGVLLAIGIIASFAAIGPRGPTRLRRAAAILLSLSGAGLIMDGIWTIESFMMHFIGFGLGAGLTVVSFAVAGAYFRKLPGWERVGALLLVASPLTLVLLAWSLATFSIEATQAGTGIAGLTQRIAITQLFVPFVVIGWKASRRRGTSPPVSEGTIERAADVGTPQT